jgi:cell wall-associated NlpC family hydrolase
VHGVLVIRRQPGHVGLVIGDGRMVEAPGAGLRIRVSVIGDRSDLVGYLRVPGGQ